MKTHTQITTEVTECERLAKLYNTLYELLGCPGFEQLDMCAKAKDTINKELASGEIHSLDALGARFDELADAEYRKANQLLKQFNKTK